MSTFHNIIVKLHNVESRPSERLSLGLRNSQVILVPMQDGTVLIISGLATRLKAPQNKMAVDRQSGTSSARLQARLLMAAQAM